MHADSLRRFTQTPFENSFVIGDLTVRVETNSQFLAHRLVAVLATAAPEVVEDPVFRWRVVVEADDEPAPESTSVGQLNKDGLALITLGQSGFLACDAHARLGIAFVTDRFVHDEPGFHQYFLPALISMSSRSLECC